MHYSNAPPDPKAFPTTPGSFQPHLAADNDAFLTKFDPSGRVVYSTYFGGVFEDLAIDVAADSAGCAYVTGVTDSPDFPTRNAYQSELAGAGDAFVTKFNPDGSELVYSTYLGGTGEEIGWGIALDASSNVYLTGYTYSVDYPVVNPVQPSNAGSSDAFITRINSAGSALVYSTYFGGSDGEKSADIVFSLGVDGDHPIAGDWDGQP